MNITSKILPFLLVAVAALQCDAAAAAGTEPLPQRTVSFADLNLNRPEGIKVLYRRLHYAAKRVCDGDRSLPYAYKRAAEKCSDAALREAVAQISNANLTAYYNQATRKSARGEARVASDR